MDVGVDTFRSRLDLVTWDGFRLWNGGTMSGGQLVGGQPAFAGRHFLGGADFLWGHGEATDCMTNPRPENLSQLTTLTPLIAPIQAPFSDRQPITGVLGSLYGGIDARALCDRLAAALQAGEFTLPTGGRVHVWLSIDSGVDISSDYWAGWADRVNTFAFFAPGLVSLQPFRAAVLCRFNRTQDGKLRPDARVVAALQAARTAWRGSNTTSHACWADAPTTDAPNWAVFAGGPTPLVWRTAHGFNQTGFTAEPNIDVDRANPGGTVANATDSMLVTQSWQPNVPSLLNFGFITDQCNGITRAQMPTLKTNPIPQMQDLGGHYNLPGGSVGFIGRYLKPTVADPARNCPAGSFAVKRPEAEMLSDEIFDIFTIWEDINTTVRGAGFQGQPTEVDYFDPVHNAGTDDGTRAFAYCGNVLQQPPHTPVFFTVDFDAGDPNDPRTHHAPAQDFIEEYLTKIKEERDAYVAANPDWPYLIGMYGPGEVLRWCYRQGIVSLFWQSVGPGSTGNPLPNRPWFHANRWQFSKDSRLVAAGWNVVPGADPDADWGDGGAWNLREPLLRELAMFRRIGMTPLRMQAPMFDELLIPIPTP